MSKHKHAEVIHAWANGAKVQVKYESVGCWQDSTDPVWFTEWEYRIKPSDIQETGCAKCGVKTSDGYALYCVKCIEPMRQWIGLTDDEIAQSVGSPLDEVYLSDFHKVIAKLKEKNT